MLRRHISPSSSSSSLPHTWFKSSSLPSNRRGTISPLRISPSPCPTPHALLKHRCSQKLLHSVPSTPGPEADTPIESFNASRLLGVPAREYLKKWQDEFGKPNIEQLADYERHPLHNWLPDDLRGRFSHSPIEQNNDGDDYEDAHSGDPELDTTALFLKPGDIAELVFVHLPHIPALCLIMSIVYRTVNQFWQHSFRTLTSKINSFYRMGSGFI